MTTPSLLKTFFKDPGMKAIRVTLSDLVHYIKATSSEKTYLNKHLKSQLRTALKLAVVAGLVAKTKDGKFKLLKASPNKGMVLPKKAVKVRNACMACRKKAARGKKQRAQKKRKAVKRGRKGPGRK